MNTGQMMLTTAALILLGLTIFSVNSNTLQNGVILNQTEIGISAVSLATSYIQKASDLRFDEKTINNFIQTDASGTRLVAPTTTNLTSNARLGRDGTTETANQDTTFDDFDDYSGFWKTTDTIPGVDVFTTRDTVYYINPQAPNLRVTGPTFFKRMDIRVFGTVGRAAFTGQTDKGIDTIKLSYIYSYYR